MAEKNARGAAKTEDAAKKTAAKAAEPVKRAAEKTEATQKPQNAATPNKPTGGSTVGLRIGACVLWLLAIVCEVFAVMAIMEYYIPPFNKTAFLIVAIVLDMALAIAAAQLWKKANRIRPMSEKRGKFLFYLWNELGVIMACICFLPLIVLLLKSNKLDKKTKLIASILAIVALLITGVASADFNPISAEQKEEAEAQITQDVYWTQFGHKYHLKRDENGDENGCPYIRNSNSVKTGTVTEAIEAGRTAICSYCASHYAEELGLNLDTLNVEDREAVDAPSNDLQIQTEAPASDEGE